MNVVFVTILLGLLLSALDQTIVSTALPTIVKASVGVPPGVLRPFFRDVVTAGYLARADDGVLALTERGQAEVDQVVAAWKAWLMGELRGWLEEHEVDSEQRREVEEALGRITLRLVREADAEAGRTGVPSGRRAVQAGGRTT
jgi:hypothetical protein